MKSKLTKLEDRELKSINGGDGQYYKRYYFDWGRMEWRIKVVWKEEGEN